MYVRSQKSVASDAANAPRNSKPIHVCQAPGCTREIPKPHLMCSTHWFEVPEPVRLEVLQTLASFLDGTITPVRYFIARLDAIIHVGELHGEDVAALKTKRNYWLEKRKEENDETS